MLKNRLHLYGNEDVRVPAHLNFGKEVYDNMVKNKDITALINADTGAQMTYGEAAQITAHIALSLTRMGVRKGEVVCICTDKDFEYMPTVMGIICAGAIFSPLDPKYGSFLTLNRLNIAKPKVMFCSLSAYETHKKTFEEVGSIQHYILYGNESKDGAVLFTELLAGTIQLEDFEAMPVNGWEDAAVIIYSSGTTGLSKGVPFTHLSFLSDSQHVLIDESKGVRVYNSGEIHDSFSLVYALACLRANATIVFNPSGGEKNMLEAVQKYKLEVLQLFPMAAVGLATSAILDSYDVSSVKSFMAPGTHIWDEAVRRTKQRFPNPVRFFRMYGMTECGTICDERFATKGSKPESAGKLANGVVLKVVDLDTREPLGPNQRGEICVKGYSIIKEVLQLFPMAAVGLATSAILDSYDVSSVKSFMAPGTHIWDEAVRRTKQRFPNPVRFFRMYGMTECGTICDERFATKGSKPESAGKLANGVVLKVVDLDTREPLGPNQRGEICVKGYSIIKAYSNNAVPDFKDEEGFFKTGDIGYYDSDGHIYLVNRLKEIIKMNGCSVAPAELEALLLQHPSVLETCVVGKPHSELGEVPVAFIVLQPGSRATEEELVQHVDRRVAITMRLAGGVRFIDRLPRNRAGQKLDRKDLMQRLVEEDANAN